MQRTAAAAYVSLFLVVAIGAYGASVTATPPDVTVDADQELGADESVTLGGTTYTVSELNGTAGTATIEWNQGNNTTSVQEGGNVTLGETQYVAHFEGDRLQLSDDYEAYREEIRAVEDHEQLVHDLQVLSTLSGLTAILLAAMAYMPVRRD